jgi:curved DNA-binding protein CbpA
MPGSGDPYGVLGVKPGASVAEIHAAYRAAVRRTHPDAGGSPAAFEAVQAAYDALRDPASRERVRSEPRPRERPSAPAPDAREARRRMDDLLAESRRLEDEARRLAGLPPLHQPPAADEPVEDSIGAVVRDAGAQLLGAAGDGIREIRRVLRGES